jgi:hypothetical protein
MSTGAVLTALAIACVLGGAMTSNTQQQHADGIQQGILGVLARLSWFAIGNVVLLFLAISIVRSPERLAYDIAFGGVVLGLMLTRYVDISFLNGQTVENKPATKRDWGHYVARLFVIGGVMWGLAHLLGALLR